MASEVRQDDCLEVVRGLAGEAVDLVYVDPPFFTQKTHSLVTRDRAIKFEFSDEWKSRSEYIEPELRSWNFNLMLAIHYQLVTL